MCLSAFRGQAAIKQTLPAGFLGSRVLDPGEGAWSPSSSRPVTTIPVVSMRWCIGVYGGSYKMRRTRMRPSRWMMASSVRASGPNSKGFSQSTKRVLQGPPGCCLRVEHKKGQRKRIHNRMIMMAWTAYDIQRWWKTTMRTFVPQERERERERGKEREPFVRSTPVEREAGQGSRIRPKTKDVRGGGGSRRRVAGARPAEAGSGPCASERPPGEAGLGGGGGEASSCAG